MPADRSSRRRARRPALRLENLEDRAVFAAGALDLTFGADGRLLTPIGGLNNSADAVAVQADGKIVVAGSADAMGNDSKFALTRHHPDGSADLSFGGDGTVTTTIVGYEYAYASAVAVQADGKIVVAGSAYNAGAWDFALVRYLPDGSPDRSFGGDGTVTTAFVGSRADASAVAVQADGKTVVAGSSYNGGGSVFALARYNSDGSPDVSFDADGTATTQIGGYAYAYAVAVQADSRIIAAGSTYNDDTSGFALVRYNPDGSPDTSFDSDGTSTTVSPGSGEDGAAAIALQADGKIVTAGSAWNGTANEFILIRYNPNGSLDPTFAVDGTATTTFGGSYAYAAAVAVQADGRIVAAGSTYNEGTAGFALARYNPDGSPDLSFDGDGTTTTQIGSNAYAAAVAVQADGKIIAAGNAYSGGSLGFVLVRYRTDGSLDRLSDGKGKVTTAIGSSDQFASAVAVQADGKLVVAGRAVVGGTWNFAVSRYNPDGSLDVTFGGDGTVTTQVGSGADYANALAIQPDGRIVVAGQSVVGSTWDFALARYLPDGSLDPSFDGDGTLTTPIGGGEDVARGVAVLTDGRIVAAGYASNESDHDFALVGYKPDGSPDLSFGTAGKVITAIGDGEDVANAIAVLPNGRIVVAGSSFNGTDYDFALAWYYPSGYLDRCVTTPVGTSYDLASAVAVQADGKVVAAGQSFTGTYYDFALARYKPDGSLDTTFGGDGTVTTALGESAGYAAAVAVQADGKIVAAGSAVVGGTDDFALARYNRDGRLDTTFDDDGHVTAAFGHGVDNAAAVAVQADGRIVAAGTTYNGTTWDFALIRLRGDNRAPVPVPTTMTLAEDTTLVVPRPAYVYDPDGDPVTTQLLSAPAHGTLDLTPYGSFTYTPDPDFHGTDRFAYKVSDAFGGFDVGSVGFAVTPVPEAVEVRDDPALPGKKSMFVTGTPKDDAIAVEPVGLSRTAYRVTRNGGPAEAVIGVTGRVYVAGLAGNDSIRLGGVRIPVWLDGGPGDDTLVGGLGPDSLTGGPGNDLLDGGAGTDRLVEAGDVDFTLVRGTARSDGRLTGLGVDVLARNRVEQADLSGGPGANRIDASVFTGRTWLRGGGGADTLRGGRSTDLLLGGEGDDDLDGGAGRDVLIGGPGADLLRGGAGDDLLIGGGTTRDGNVTALDAILAVWSGGAGYSARVRHLLGALDATTLLDDVGAADTLFGGLGLDWFGTGPGDTADRTGREQVLTV